jgi:predicted metal-dependent HD superfamily phosphohydrolase
MNNIIIKYTLNEEEENYLKTCLFSTLKYFKVPEDKAEEIYDRLYCEYNDWNRHYHNLSHILSLINLREKYADKIIRIHQFDLAIWFHDSIYDAKKKDNEVQSADLFIEFMRPYLTKEELIFVKSLILSTIKHFPLLPEDSDHHFFLDFDLAVLSAEKETYLLYSDAIKGEYKTIFSFLVYSGGRKKVLESFNQRESIYFSQIFRENYEQKARENLAWESEHL